MILTGFHFRGLLLFIFALHSGINGQNSDSPSGSTVSSNIQVVPPSGAPPADGASPTTAPLSPDPLKGYRVVCLYNHKQFYRQKFTPDMIDPEICTHINYEFAILDPKTYEMTSGEPDIDYEMYKSAVNLKQKNKRLKVLLSIGGWEDSTKKYSDLVASGERVENFIKKCITFLQLHGFDGLDVAWEYPNCWKGACGVNPNDKDNFSEFLEKIQKRFDKEGLILSVSVGSLKREIEKAYDVPQISKHVDHINVMTYDMHGPWEKQTGHHTQMDRVAGDEDPFCNAKGAIDVWISLGVNKTKLNLGTATYAKTFTLADPSKHGLSAPVKGPGRPGATTKTNGYLCYFEICQFLNAGNWTEDEHKGVGFYAFSGDQWACYDPPMMVVRKAKWVVDYGLGGVLIKDISCDDYKGACFHLAFPLTKMIKMEIINRVKKLERG